VFEENLVVGGNHREDVIVRADVHLQTMAM
jgi:hypothetical protein